jgi:hypothetical protein
MDLDAAPALELCPLRTKQAEVGAMANVEVWVCLLLH